MSRRYGLSFLPIIALTVALVACGGASTATDTPRPPTPTAPPTATSAPAATPTLASTATPAVAPPTATRAANAATTGTTSAGTSTTGTTAAGSSTIGTGLTIYTDTQGRFSFSRPSAWMQQVGASSDVLVQFNGATPLLSVNIVVSPLSPTVPPDRYLPLVIDQLKRTFPDLSILGTAMVPIGGEQGTQIDYTGTTSGAMIYFSQIYVLHKGNAYVLTLACQQADADRARQQAMVVVQTWTFLT